MGSSSSMIMSAENGFPINQYQLNMHSDPIDDNQYHQIYGQNEMANGMNTLSFTQINMLNSNLTDSYDNHPPGTLRETQE